MESSLINPYAWIYVDADDAKEFWKTLKQIFLDWLFYKGILLG